MHRCASAIRSCPWSRRMCSRGRGIRDRCQQAESRHGTESADRAGAAVRVPRQRGQQLTTLRLAVAIGVLGPHVRLPSWLGRGWMRLPTRNATIVRRRAARLLCAVTVTAAAGRTPGRGVCAGQSPGGLASSGAAAWRWVRFECGKARTGVDGTRGRTVISRLPAPRDAGTGRSGGCRLRRGEAKFLCLYRHPMDVIASGIEACP